MGISDLKSLKERLENEIKESSRVFVVGHNSPDFDSIGSAIGISEIVKSFGKECYIVVDDDTEKIEPGVRKIINDSKNNHNFCSKQFFLAITDKDSLLVVTDVNKRSMISVGDSLDKVKNVIVIDHHNENEDTIETNDLYISKDTSSASESVARLLGLFKIQYSSEVANYLLAGICLDTKRFKQNTTSKTHDVAEMLIYKGADINFVNNLFLEEFESFCRISNLIINGTVIKKYTDSLFTPLQVSFTLNRNNPHEIYLKEDYAKAADKMMKFNGIDASFALGYVDENTIHISARGGKKVDVGEIMKAMSGGGNFQSAGARIVSEDIIKVEEELMSKIYLGVSNKEEISKKPQIVKLKQLKKQKK